MAEFDCDTVKLGEAGETIMKTAEEISLLLARIYKKIYGIQNASNPIWIGLASNHFLEKTASDADDAQNFCAVLKQYGNLLKSGADSLDTIYEKHKRV